MAELRFKGTRAEFVKWWTTGKGSEELKEKSFIIKTLEEEKEEEGEEKESSTSDYIKDSMDGEPFESKMDDSPYKYKESSSRKDTKIKKSEESKGSRDKYGIKESIAPIWFKNKLKSVFKDNALNRPLRNRIQGDLDMKHLYKVNTSPRVFEKKESLGGKKYSVVILVDCSGSMQVDRKNTIAASCAEALIDQFQGLVDIQVMTFNNKVKLLKSFDKKIKPEEMRKRVGNVIVEESLGDGSYSNHDWQGILQSAKALLTRNNIGKKIILTLSDGNPECSYYKCESRGLAHECRKDSNFIAATKEAVHWAESRGITTLGVGIRTQAVKSFYKDYVVVNEVEHLYEAIVSLLNKTIKRKPVVV